MFNWCKEPKQEAAEWGDAAIKHNQVLLRARRANDYLNDTAAERKEAWLRAQRPHLKIAKDGAGWWCVSEYRDMYGKHKLRVGRGMTPLSAYNNWKSW